MASLKTVITVPHAACPPDPTGHLCDLDAPKIARALHAGLPDSVLIESEVHRDSRQLATDGEPGSDQNRSWARDNTLFRGTLREALERKPRLLLDVHSFPDGHFDELEIVVLDPAGGHDPASRALVEALAEDGLVAGLKGVSGTNAIVTEARALGAEAVLIEFGERMGAQRREIAIATTVAWAHARVASVQVL